MRDVFCVYSCRSEQARTGHEADTVSSDSGGLNDLLHSSKTVMTTKANVKLELLSASSYQSFKATFESFPKSTGMFICFESIILPQGIYPKKVIQSKGYLHRDSHCSIIY